MIGVSACLQISKALDFRLRALFADPVTLLRPVNPELSVLWHWDQHNISIGIMANKSIVRLGLLARVIQNLKLLLPLIREYLKGNYRDVSAKSIVIFFLTLAYIISPVDLIPDWILGLGQLDDIGILGLSLHWLEKDLLKYKEWKDRINHQCTAILISRYVYNISILGSSNFLQILIQI
jgi:uncharacterized membrane protein YkvA (DUF1232 family)